MESTEPKRRRRKKTVSAMTATLPIIEGGEVPIPIDAPKRRRKSSPSPRKSKKTAPAVVAPQFAGEGAGTPPDVVLENPAQAVYAGVPVRITAIGDKRVVVTHDAALAAEGDLILRIPGLFAELSKLGGRVAATGGQTVIEITRNAVYLTFALEALRHPLSDTRPRLSITAPTAETKPARVRLLAPTRALPATFGDARVALLEVEGTSMRVAHSKPLPLEGDHPFAIKTDVADFSGSDARVISWERLQDGGEVYVSTLEITRNAVSFTCGIEQLVRAQMLQEKSDKPAAADDIPIIESDPTPLPHPRDVRPPLVPVVRLNPPPRRKPVKATAVNRKPIAIGVALLIAIVSIVAYVKRPDEHFVRARKMIEAYEQGLMPSERDYSLPVYVNAVNELESVRASSVSHSEAEKLAKRLRELIQRQNSQRTVKASALP